MDDSDSSGEEIDEMEMESRLVQDVLSLCPASMGSGLHTNDTDSSRRLRVQAVGRIKSLLERIKGNMKVYRTLL